ncbi:hypothetical protein [Streptomyces vinaceus]|uniref:hypothetical protein n=1 Tax=Streptomyces vinaceus TaxID=1960 RepID=UPI0036B090C6
MPVQPWVPDGTDLAFVSDRRPRDARDLLKKGRPWTDLFVAWYRYTDQTGWADAALWTKLVKSHAQTGSLQKSLRVVKDAAPRMNAWNGLVGRGFFNACGDLRLWLEAEHERARRDLEKEEGPVSWWHSGAREKAVRQRMRTNMAGAVAEKRLEQLKKKVRADSAEQKLALRLVEMEKVMVGCTRTLKPRFAELCRHFAQVVKTQEPQVPDELVRLRQRLGEAHGQLVSAEAYLRDICRYLREDLRGQVQPDVAGQPKAAAGEVRAVTWRPEKPEEELLKAWEQYTRAYAELPVAMRANCEGIVRWAAADTAKKIKENFGTVHPHVEAAQLFIHFSVVVLGTALDVLALAAVAVGPQATAAIATARYALQAGLEGIEALTVDRIAAADARDRDVVLEHAARTYVETETAEVAERFAAVVNAVHQPIAPALEWMAEADAANGQGLVKGVPVVGQLWRLGGLLVRLEKVANPRQLKDDIDADERKALLEALQHAFADRIASQEPVEVEVLKVTDAGEAELKVNGTPGVLANGRFHAADRAAAFEETLRQWPRRGRARDNDFDPDNISVLGGFVVDGRDFERVRFVLQVDGGPVTSKNLASAVRSEGEGGLGFLCRGYASSTLGMGPEVVTSRWHIAFRLGYEGEVVSLDPASTELDWLLLRAPGDTASAIAVYTKADVAKLLGSFNRTLTPSEFFPLLPWVLGVPPQHFVLHEGVLLDGGGNVLMSADDLTFLVAQLPAVEELRDRLDSGRLDDIQSVNVTASFFGCSFGGWKAPLDHHRALLAEPDPAERRRMLDGITDEQGAASEVVTKLKTLLEADRELSASCT